ncbi:Type I Iterative Polyketide synthase (PKS) [Pseudogymnoascus sp. 05NY08]|nr:Type I Iterative Polyketide synthase (PKS) [Pseudogymnoascus sp. 05NY08]
MPTLAPAHPSLRALALDVEAALASLSQRLDSRLDLLEARSLGGSASTETSASTSSPRPIHRRPVLPYAPDTPPLSAPLREEVLLEEEQQRRVTEVLTPGSSVNEGAGGSVQEGEGEDKSMPIAIVGMGCRFPQEATSPEKLWEMLYNKRHARTEVPKDRFNAEAFYHPDADRSGSMNLKGGHYLKEDIATFDARFFSISPAEAKSMDPMQRILLEVVYEAMENAGITLADLDGSDTGCYVGCFTDDYDGLLKRDMELSPKYHSVGIVPAILSNRISFCFNLKGPSLTVDTACSSSLVAVHLACQSLRAGESRVAIVGATNALINPEIHVGMSNMHFLSPDSTCFTFDERANGYARGEGMAALILKPLDAALRDGDTIRAVIRGTASNQDGKTAGMTLPSKEAQAELIQTAYEQAGCDPAATGYFEAHGTGTAAGDPIEASAIGATLGKFRRPGEEGKLFVGSVKTNIGHLEGASGLAGLIKAVLSLERGVVLPNLWFENGNPAIDFEGWRIKVPTEPTAWPTEGLRRASINSFGFGGTNCHAIIDDAFHYLQSRRLKGNHTTSPRSLLGEGMQRPLLLGGGGKIEEIVEGDAMLASSASALNARPRIFKVSANEEKLAVTLAKSFAEHLATIPTDTTDTAYLDNLAYTLHTRRTTLPWTVAVVASSIAELATKLEAPGLKPTRRAAETPKLGFVFTGQGAQWAGMGRELLSYPVFKDVVTKADGILASLGAPWSLLTELSKPESESRINEAAISQPLCTALQIALADLLSSWSVHPARVVGHSSGEIAAAYAIGALSLKGALQVAYFRGVHSSRVSSLGLRGAMMAVGLDETAARGYAEGVDAALGRVVVACINSPRSVTVSGDESAIEALKNRLDADGVFARRLVVDTAYHSHHMHSIAAAYRADLEDLAVTPPGQRWPIEMISSVTSRSASDEALDADYWVRNMVSPVQFSSALAHLCTPEPKGKKKGQRRARGGAVNILVELGPHAALGGPVKQILTASTSLSKAGITYLPALLRNKDGAETILALAASLSASGHGADVHTANFPSPPPQPLATLPDLPSYAWNHSTRYWAESRLSLDYRHRPFPRTDVLGAQSTDWNPTEPMWRNFVRLSELPWLKHHQVQDTVIYPAAGYVCMALEAAAQVLSVTALPPGRMVRGFTVRDLAISRALVVPQSEEGVETVFSMRPLPDSTTVSSAAWREFRVFSYGDGGWAEHCRGVVGVDFAPASAAVVAATGAAPVSIAEMVGADEFEEGERAARAEMEKAQRVCDHKGDVGGMYDALAAGGLWYGPSFRVITSVATGGGMAVGRVAVPDTRSTMPMEFEYPSLVHPATLDGFIQMIIPALSQGDLGSAVHEPFVPTFIEELSFASSIASQAGYEFRACAKAAFKGVREAVAGITVFDPLGGEAVVKIKGMKCTAISGGGPVDVVRKHCGTAVWEPDVDLLGDLQMLRVLRGAAVRAASPGVAGREDVEIVAWWFCDAALRDVKEVEVSPQRRGLYEFLLHQREVVRVGRAEYQTPLWEALEDFATQERVHNLIADFSTSDDAEAKLLVRMGMALPGVLRGEMDPDVFRQESGVVNEYFSTALGVPHTYAAMQRYLTMLAHKYPDLEYLELGAGTGDATRHVLDALDGCAKYRYPKIKAYTYSDPSDATFAATTKAFEKWGSLFETRVLDIAGDIGAQGFAGRQFDVVIAANSLGNAGVDVEAALANVRALLKPGGKLILLEATHIHLSAAVILTRPAPPLQEHQWEDVLSRHGFGGLEASAPDVLDARAHVTSVMVASVLKPDANVGTLGLPLSLHVVLVAPYGGGAAAAELLDSTCSALGGHGIGVEIVSFNGLARTELTGKIVICLAELDASVLAEVLPADFAQLQRLTSEPVGLLWITRGSIAGRSSKPELSIFQGLARSLRAEQEGFPCVTVDLDADYRLPPDQVVDLLFGVFRQTFVRGSAAAVNDREFAERNGILHVKRMVEDDAFNKYIATRTGAAALKPRAEELVQPGRPLKLTLDGVGSLDSFYFSDDPTVGDNVPIAKGEVEISVQAVGLNFRDILIAMGEMSDNYLGNECAGIVTQVGEGVTHVSVGDRVAVWCLGCFATLMRNPADTVMRIPDDMDFVTAAGFPIIYVTAYYALVHLARMQAGESVLIHAAAGGVGQAAIQIAQRLGAEVYVTVGTGEKKAHIMSLFGIPAERIFSSRDVSFEAGVKRVTDGRGVDVVLNSLAGESLRASWRCVAPFGRFVELGKRDIEAGGRLDMGPFVKNVVFASVDITAMLRLNRRLGSSMFEEAMEMGMEIRRELEGKGMGEGGANPVRTWGFGEVGEAFRHMQAGRHVGKIVVVPGEGDVVQVMPQPLKGAKFHADASYLLAGGLGGIGRSLSMWMVANGARNLIFVSRSGVSNDAARELVSTLMGKGVRVEVIQCDIADEVRLFDSLNASLRTMPPIRGVIQGAMVLRDQIFANMPYETFVSALRPKVQGSWSLHQATLDQPLDFFVLLSSASSFLGNAGQGNYVAACTYQVALAQHRLGLGLPATAIDIGKVASVGVVAESKDTTIEENLIRIGLKDIQEAELHAIIELAMLPNAVGVTNGHLITGAHTSLDPGADIADLPFWSRDPVFSHLDALRPHLARAADGSGGASSAGRASLKTLLGAASSKSAAVATVLEALLAKLARALAMPVAEIDASRSTAAYGIDSLLAVDIRNWIFREAGADVAVFEVLQAGSVGGLAGRVVEGSAFLGAAASKVGSSDE